MVFSVECFVCSLAPIDGFGERQNSHLMSFVQPQFAGFCGVDGYHLIVKPFGPYLHPSEQHHPDAAAGSTKLRSVLVALDLGRYAQAGVPGMFVVLLWGAPLQVLGPVIVFYTVDVVDVRVVVRVGDKRLRHQAVDVLAYALLVSVKICAQIPFFILQVFSPLGLRVADVAFWAYLPARKIFNL